MKNHIKMFFAMCRNKIARPQDTQHVSWVELFVYSLRQFFHLLRKTYDKPSASYRQIDAQTASIQTSFGEVVVPPSLGVGAISSLLREALDPRHWHQYHTADTPITSDDIIVDCGASEGIWALSVVEKVRKIYLIEPQSDFIRTLNLTFSAWTAKDRAEIIEGAAGDSDGTCTISNSPNGVSIDNGVQYDDKGTTKSYKLDTLFKEKPITYIKADIEGFEMELLKGAREVIKRDKPKIAITVYHPQNDWQEMKDYLLDLVPEYHWKLKGLVYWGQPMLLHMWTT